MTDFVDTIKAYGGRIGRAAALAGALAISTLTAGCGSPGYVAVTAERASGGSCEKGQMLGTAYDFTQEGFRFHTKDAEWNDLDAVHVRRPGTDWFGPNRQYERFIADAKEHQTKGGHVLLLGTCESDGTGSFFQARTAQIPAREQSTSYDLEAFLGQPETYRRLRPEDVRERGCDAGFVIGHAYDFLDDQFRFAAEGKNGGLVSFQVERAGNDLPPLSESYDRFMRTRPEDEVLIQGRCDESGVGRTFVAERAFIGGTNVMYELD